MVAVPINTSVEQVIDLLKTKPYSRIPVYEGSIHNIKGILHTQDILQVPDSEAHTRTVDTLMRRRRSTLSPKANWSATCCGEMQTQ